ncbi:MAG: carbohydrate binding family 9 domain-containing protein, partial [Acidobacteriota bacterium]|nr:carbohydrate binding family 9 domain-containing protein [Acidobacteriota bacterium]
MKNTLALLFVLLLCAPWTPAQTPASSPLASPQTSPSEQSKSAATVDLDGTSRYVRKDAPVQIPHFEIAPVIDGQLNDAIWRKAAVFGDFLQTQPGDNVKPTHPTEVLMGYDAKNLYLAFNAKQDRDKIRATFARRDNIFNDDYVLVHLDTFNDQRQAYLLFFSPLGIQADGTFSEERGEDYSLDIVMESKGVLTEDGFTIEVAIPFKSLRYEAGKNKQWGLHINRRVKYSNNEYNSWMPTNRSVSGWLNQAGKITGLEGIETTRQLELNPSVTLSQSGRRTEFTFNNDPAGRYVNEGVRGDFGMTAKFGLTPTITLDFAYNPDFAQVEADAPVTTANQRFPIFFPEKRPFFLERIDIFQSGLNVVNTRAIVDPDIAAKLTGRRGRNTFGLLYASDNAPGNYSKDEREDLLLCQRRRLANPDLNIVCEIERFVDKNADIGVLRVKRDIGRQHNLGIFATTYNFIDRHNHTGGFDGRFRLTPKVVTEFQVLGTHTRGNFYDADLDRVQYRTGNGFGYRAFAERASRNLYMNFLATGRTRDYVADVGFTQRTDTNYFGSFIQYETDRDAKKRIISKRISTDNSIRSDWSGRSQSWQSRNEVALALQRQTNVNFGVQLGYERVFEHEFGAKRTATRQGAFFGPDPERSSYTHDIYAYASTTPSKKFSAFALFSYTIGQLDYDYGNGRDFPRVSPAALQFGQNAPFDPGAGNQITLDTNFLFQPTTEFQTQLSFKKARLVRNDTRLVAFDDNIFSSRSTYQFTRNTFARLRVDYSTLSNRIRPQFVLGWT